METVCPIFCCPAFDVFFSIRLKIFPVIATGISVQSVALPAITLAIAMSAKYLRQVRAAVLDELSKDYVVGARARGISFYTTLTKVYSGRRW